MPHGLHFDVDMVLTQVDAWTIGAIHGLKPGYKILGVKGNKSIEAGPALLQLLHDGEECTLIVQTQVKF